MDYILERAAPKRNRELYFDIALSVLIARIKPWAPSQRLRRLKLQLTLLSSKLKGFYCDSGTACLRIPSGVCQTSWHMRIMSFFFLFFKNKNAATKPEPLSANSHLRLKGHLQSFLGNLDTENFLFFKSYPFSRQKKCTEWQSYRTQAKLILLHGCHPCLQGAALPPW